VPIYRLQTYWQWDSAFPRDRFMINPVFNMLLPSPDPDALCEDLATALKTHFATVCELRVKAYDCQAAKPVYPSGDALRDQGLLQTSGVPRELAVCLSFYSQRNEPRKRGRIFVPAQLLGGTMGNRPSVAQRDKVAALGPIFANLGGVDVDWSVFSKRDNQARAVTNYYVDDEWDVQRSRGLRSTARTTGTTSEL
jgi:hypothetical protein